MRETRANNRTTARLPRLRLALTGSVAGSLAGCLAGCLAGSAWAGPEGGEVVAGRASIMQQGSHTTVDQATARLAIDWESFDVAAGESVRFNQPDASSVALNRIFDQNASQIFGAIDANGRVFLLNPNGVVFGSSARINVAGLLASSASLSVSDFMAGDYELRDTDPAAGVIRNQGIIQASDGGFVVLFGEGVENEGVILADLGSIDLAAGTSATLDFNGDGLLLFEVGDELTENLTPLADGVTNTGELVARGGRILLTTAAARDVFAHAVNNEGIAVASRIDDTGGVIRLVSSGDTVNSGILDASGPGTGDRGGEVEVLGRTVTLSGSAVVNVSGDAGGGTALIGGDYQGTGEVPTADFTQVDAGATILADAAAAGNGGKVIVWADDTTRFHGDISARGGAASGDGGFAEISGKQSLAVSGHADLSAANGSAGTLLLDPGSVSIVDGPDAAPPVANNTFNDGWLESQLDVSDTVVTTVLPTDGSEETITVEGDVSVTWDTTNSLTLTAGQDINLAGTFDSATGELILNVGQNDAGGVLDLDGAVLNVAASANGGAGTDTILGTSAADAFATSATDAGTVGGVTYTGFENLSGLGGADTFALNHDVTGTVDGGDGNDTVTLAEGVTVGTLTGGTDNDTLALATGTDPNEWTVDAADAGTVSVNGGTVQAFAEFENLTGNGGADAFTFAAALTGTAAGEAGDDLFSIDDGGDAGTFDGGADEDTQSYAPSTGPVTVAIGDLESIETLEGSTGATDTLQGTNDADAFATSATDAGTVGGVAYSGFENLSGLAGADTFALNDDVTGTVDGGGGGDTVTLAEGVTVGTLAGGADTDTLALAAGTGPNTWTINAADAGTVSVNGAPQTFDEFENLTGNGGVDTFTFTAALTGTAAGEAGDDVFVIGDGGAAGTFDGGADDDTQSYALSTGPVTLAIGDLESIEALEGSASATDTLQGTNGADAFATSAMDAGTVGGVTYAGFENLSGLGGADTFALNDDVTGTVGGGGGGDAVTLAAGVTVGILAGGADADTLALAAGTGPNAWTINAADAGTVSVNGAPQTFDEFENLTGNDGADGFTLSGGSVSGTVAGGGGIDTLTGDAVATTWSITGADAGSVTGGVTGSVDAFTAIENLTGGSAADDFRLEGGTLSGIATGSGGNDTVTGTADADAFATTAANSGTVGALLTYTAVENLSGLGGADTFALNHDATGTVDGGDGNDTMTLAQGVAVGALIGGAAAAGGDTLALAAGSDPNTWTVNAVNAGTVSVGGGAAQAFAGFENLTGNDRADTFTFTAALTGTAAGGAGADVFSIGDGGDAGTFDGGADNDTQSYGLSTGPVTLAIGDLESIETLEGSASATDTLQGTNGADAFATSAMDAGTVGGVAYSDFENLTGLAGADTFTLSHDVSGSVNAGGGDDAVTLAEGVTVGTLTGGAAAAGGDTLALAAGSDPNTWTVNAANAGTVSVSGGTAQAFAGFENLTGNGGADTFTLQGDFIPGVVAGRGGADVFDIDAAVSADLLGESGGDGFNLRAAASGTVSGGEGNDTFRIEADVAADLQGHAGADSFVFTAQGALTGAADGGAGIDLLDYTADASGVDVMLDSAGPNGSGGSVGGVDFSNVDVVAGGAGADTFRVNATLAADLSGNGGNDDFVFADGVALTGDVSGGSGIDELNFSANTAGTNVTLNASTGAGASGTASGIAGSFSGIDVVLGGSGAETFTVAAAATTDLHGNDGDDVFNLRADAIGANSGGAGNDTFNVDGNVTANLDGGSDDDRFVFVAAARLDGTIDGGNGQDALDFSSVTTASDVTLIGQGSVDGFRGNQAAIATTCGAAAAACGFDNIDRVVVGAGTLTGSGDDSSWAFGGDSALDAGGRSLSFAGFGSVIGGAGDDSVTFSGVPAAGGFSFDGGGGANGVTVSGPLDFGATGRFTLSGVSHVALEDPVTAGTLDWTVDGQVSQAPGAVLSATALNLVAAGGVDLGGTNQLQSLTVQNLNGGAVTISNGRSMTATVDNAQGDIRLNLTGDGSTLTIGELISNGDFEVQAAGNILAIGGLSTFQGSTASQAVVTAGGTIGTSEQSVTFDGFSPQTLPSGQAPIRLFYRIGAFLNTPGNPPVDDQGGGAVIEQSRSVATLSQADAVSRRDTTDIDWAAYSQDIRLYSANNEGVQLPEDQRLDEFAWLQRLLMDLLEQPEVTTRAR